ncbi:MAG TPA: 2-oxo acid dehydrogenase subunit E2, partial [Gemmataceae bacterium]|nr:2-oxo acid dehydrogenase subunit E2 [Gemmataceae bacterium]
PHTAAANVPALPDFSQWGDVERETLDSNRRAHVDQMAWARNLVPLGAHHDVADSTELEAIRQQQDGQGPGVTITAFALKAAANALKQFPRFNATLDLANHQLVLKKYCHLGVAVDTERGLRLPVLRDVDKKSVQQLARELADVVERARQNKLGPDELRGGTFTLMDIGSIGGTAFNPMVPSTEVAILGIARGRRQVVCAEDGQMASRWILPLSLSYDPRVIDPVEAARFVRVIAEALQNPLVMLVQG